LKSDVRRFIIHDPVAYTLGEMREVVSVFMHKMKTYWGVETKLQAFLISALNWDERSVSRAVHIG